MNSKETVKMFHSSHNLVVLQFPNSDMMAYCEYCGVHITDHGADSLCPGDPTERALR